MKDRVTLQTHELTDALVTFSDGSTTRLGELWKHGPLVLVFLRHFG
jgi:hypothetical protein